MARPNSRLGVNFRPKTVQKIAPRTFDCPHCGEAIELDANSRPIAIDILSKSTLNPATPPQMDTASRLRHLLDEPPVKALPAPAFETQVVAPVRAKAPRPRRRLPNFRWMVAPVTLTMVGSVLFFVCVVGLGIFVYNSTAPQVTPVVNVSLPTRNPTKLAQLDKPVPADQTQAPVFLPTATTEAPTSDQTAAGPDINATAKGSGDNGPTPEVLAPAVATEPSDTMGVASTGQGFGVTGAQGNATNPTPTSAAQVSPSATVTPTLSLTPSISAASVVSPTVTIAPTSTSGLPNPLAANSSGGLSSALPANTFPPASPVQTVNNQAGWINQVAFSADGKLLATANADYTVRLWNAVTGKATKVLWGHSGSVYSLSFSADGKLLATAGADRTVILWDVATGKQLFRMTGHTGEINSVAFSPGGQLLATGSNDNSVRLWDVATGKQVGIALGHQGPVQSVAFSPDGKTLASGSNDHTIMLWNLSSFSNPVQIAVLKGHNSPVWLVAFSPDGQKLASASLDNTDNLKIWDLSAGKELFNLTGNTRGVYSVAFSPDGQKLASGGQDKVVRLWSANTGDLLGTYTGATGTVTSVSFSPDGKMLLGAGEDRVIRLWKLQGS
ncbi:MAG: hypothetical protein J0I20_15160 [Chloroflexi bacterium]|nr:hypothetical protein [Chloroflexota bacterium]